MTSVLHDFCSTPNTLNRNIRALLHDPNHAPHVFSRLMREPPAAKLKTFAVKNRLARPSPKFPKVAGALRRAVAPRLHGCGVLAVADLAGHRYRVSAFGVWH